jgi:hypothetical protein
MASNVFVLIILIIMIIWITSFHIIRRNEIRGCININRNIIRNYWWTIVVPVRSIWIIIEIADPWIWLILN